MEIQYIYFNYKSIAICLIVIIFYCTTVQVVNSQNGKICVGTNAGMSGNRNEYKKWLALYKNCVYIEGNLEIANFHPYYNTSLNDEKIDDLYDFSFLDNIKEITGYLLVHNNRIKNLRLKNLRIIRGQKLFSSNISIFIDSNVRLERIDLTNLREIQNGRVVITKNPKLCHMDEVIWSDIITDFKIESLVLRSNADPEKCEKCSKTCCSPANTNNTYLINSKSVCGCWYPNSCQKLSKLICHSKCGGGRCFGSGEHECCNPECLGGCSGPKKNECTACSKLTIFHTGDCVESCPRIDILDAASSEFKTNPNGLYQLGSSCVKSCPSNLFVYKESCLYKCPSQTYEEEILLQNSLTGEKGIQRNCSKCTDQKCPRVCYLEGSVLNTSTIKSLKDCQILNSDLNLIQPVYDEPINKKIPPELTEPELEILSTIRTINGYVRIQSNKITSLNFLRNLEIIRPKDLKYQKLSLIISSSSLKTLSLKKLRTIESGGINLHTEILCLYDTINWTAITNDKNSLVINENNKIYSQSNCAKNGFVCDPTCNGCWSTGPRACQFCKTYKIDDICVESCDGNKINGRYTYLAWKPAVSCDEIQATG